MAAASQQEHNDHVILIWLSAAIVGLLGWSFFSNRYKHTPAVEKRGVRYSNALYGAALDSSLGQCTPDQLAHYGPTMRPASWTPHRVRYPATPGMMLDKLVNGAPGCWNHATPRAQRGWLFCPPAEEDI